MLREERRRRLQESLGGAGPAGAASPAGVRLVAGGHCHPPSVTDHLDRQIGLSTCTVWLVTDRQLTRRLHVDLVRVAGAACCHIHR
ncbi:putative leader peptide [Rhodococcus zopfii]|uniref:putative leader peptide n=1 Tax=Rhodococcus zopfii TaxID=43772 RepID=UPI003528317E